LQPAHNMTYIHYVLSEYTQRPLFEVPSVTGSGGSPPPNPPTSTAKNSHGGANFFSAEPMEKLTKQIKIRLTETEHQRLLDRCDRTHLAEWLRQRLTAAQ